ncbi:MAG: hypothetical protein A3J29_14040 [Acidobacteria bacterium RIFCSPLOWO2_12_FULL_67_14b]|nr:MAG: hypothetical protein A3J29_14040 [Acidobacteria bacterium RIFCSPLOWO2_12_FULL_67_14b]
MILLDTNVVSELMKVTCDPRVVQWLDAQRDSDLVTSAVTVAEIRLGIELLPDGKRKSSLAQRAEVALGSLAASTVSFDGLAAREFATIAAARRKRGRPIGYPDAQIAAIAVSAGLTLATRNIADFSDIAGLKLVDPWRK